MKNTILVAAFACLASICAPTANAATISVVPGTPINDFKYSNGTIITSTSSYLIKVGYFTNAGDANFSQSLSDANFRNTIATSFKPIGDGGANLGPVVSWDISALTGGGAGRFSIQKSLNGTTGSPLTFVDATGLSPANSVSANGIVRGTKLFLIAYNTLDPSQASEVGIYSSDQWLIPTGTSTLLTLQLSQVDTSSEVYRGSLGSLILAAVPEPSLLSLVFIGIAYCGKRKRNV